MATFISFRIHRVIIAFHHSG